MSNYDSKNGAGTGTVDPEKPARTGQAPESNVSEGTQPVETPAKPNPSSFATRAGSIQAEGISKSKLLMLGGGLAVAVLFFVFTAVVGRSPKKQLAAKSQQQQTEQTTKPSKGSLTPLMETVRSPAPDNGAGQVGPADIRRTRATDGASPLPAGVATPKQTAPSAKPLPAPSLASVPSFTDTQQRWEEPKP